MKITYNFRKPIDEFEICFRIVEATEGGGGGLKYIYWYQNFDQDSAVV